MQADETYKVGKDYHQTFEKSGALRTWSKKYVTLTGLNFSVADSEGGAASVSFEMSTAIQAEDNDPTHLTVKGGNNESVTLRAERAVVDAWYDLCRAALEFAGRAKPRNPGLPPVDPRFGLRFVEIPAEYRHRFASLESAVLYWFSPVTKYGTKSKLTGKFATENRVVLVSDKAIYVTKPDSEVTRCMKINMMKAVCTNLTVKKPEEDAFVVIKMEAPDYDLYFSAPDLENFVKAIKAIFKSITKGRDLTVRNVNTPTDASVDLQLNRPDGFTMAMVMPTTKGPLKKALDDFAKKHGIRLTTSGSATKASPPQGGAPTAAGTVTSPMQGPSKAPVPSNDPLAKFMLAIGLPETLKLLKKQHVDFDVLQIMDEDDYANFGINKNDAKIIRAQISDDAFLERIGILPGASGPAAPASMAPPAAASERAGAFDDLDDLDVKPVSKAPQRQPPQQPQPQPAPAADTISFDDLDLDDLDIDMSGSKSVASFARNIVLDSDDDLDLPPPKPKNAAPPPKVDIDDI